MVSAILLVAALGVGQQREPLFPRVFPSPSQNNALEYYVRAMDVMIQGGIEPWHPYTFRDSKDTRLQIEEQMAARTSRVLDFVRQGNRFGMTVPVLADDVYINSYFKGLFRVVSQWARVQLVRGRPDEACEALLLNYGLADNLNANGGILYMFLSRIADSIAHAMFHESYTSISLDGAESILRTLHLNEPELISRHWQVESAMVDRGMRTGSPDRDSLLFNDDDSEAIWSGGATLRSKWQQASQVVSAQLDDILSRGESGWMAGAKSLRGEGLSSDPTVIMMIDGSRAESLIETAVLARTQRRLLRVHALIAKYRWENGSLPQSLTDLPDEAHLDPAAGSPYIYQRFSEAAYDLYSPGNTWHGVIRLKSFGNERPLVDPGPP